MSIIKSNISQMWHAKHSFFIVVILVQIIAAFSILYITGATANDYLYLKEDANSNLSLYVAFDNDSAEPVNYSKIEDMLFELCEEHIPGVTDYIGISTPYFEETGKIMSVFNIEDGRYRLTDEITRNRGSMLKSGRVFTEEELNSEAYYAITDVYQGDKLIIENQEFEIIGELIPGSGVTQIDTTPYAMKSLELKLDFMLIYLDRILTTEELAGVEALFEETIPGQYSITLKTTTNDDKNAILKSSLVTSALIGVSVLVVLLIVYGYIIKLRKKNLAIWRLTGCTVRRAAFLFFTEMAVLSAPSVLLGFLLFYITQQLWLNDFYPYMAVTHTWELYIGMYLAVMLALFIVFAGIAIVNSRYSVKQQLIRADL
ncbi:MAG: hypothetical protein IJZ25_01570 [Lachnospiraceae bacterium]|nr:hypothetical protein [Lachnospiraceae bacterium]